MIRILVTNDDGIDAKGIRELMGTLSHLAEVYVFAPATQQSAKSQSMTSHSPLRVEKREIPGITEAYAVHGTPADCVKFGIQHLRSRDIEVDYVFSGVNMGANIAMDVHYSGTVGAAIEGSLYGVRSVAMSIAGYEAQHMEYLMNMIPDILELSSESDPRTVINVNSPDLPAWRIKGTKFTPTALGRCYNDTLNPSDEEDVYDYQGGFSEPAPDDRDSDHLWVRDGYATITPIQTDVTDARALARMKRTTDPRTLWIFIDYQTKLMPVIRKRKDVIRNTVKAARCAERLGAPIMLTTQYTRGLGQTVPELREEFPDAARFEKLSFSCFGTEGFEDILTSLEQKSVVLAGVETHICLRQTALDFLERGYQVTILRDCCGSRRKEDHESALRELEQKGCVVTTWETYVYDILGGATHPAFQAITNIVKEQ